jgi:hypothetical protein
MVSAKVKDAANDAEDGTELWVTTAVKSNDFATDAIFLVSEGERYKSRRFEFGVGSSEQIETPLANEELDIGESERSGVGRSGGVFARTEEEEEGQRNHVGNG